MIGRERRSWEEDEAKWDKERIGFEIERAGAAALRLFNNDPINSLVAAVNLAQKVRAEEATNFVYSPVWVLDTLLRNIQERKQLEGHVEGVVNARFSNDGVLIVTASRDGTARIWNSYSGQLVHKLSGHDKPVEYVSFNHDDSTVITTSYDNTAKIWDSQSGEPISQLNGHNGKRQICKL